MDRAEILSNSEKVKAVNQNGYRIKSIRIFGCVASEKATGQSDADVVFEISEPDLFILAAIKAGLEEQLCRQTDTVN